MHEASRDWSISPGKGQGDRNAHTPDLGGVRLAGLPSAVSGAAAFTGNTLVAIVALSVMVLWGGLTMWVALTAIRKKVTPKRRDAALETLRILTGQAHPPAVQPPAPSPPSRPVDGMGQQGGGPGP